MNPSAFIGYINIYDDLLELVFPTTSLKIPSQFHIKKPHYLCLYMISTSRFITSFAMSDHTSVLFIIPPTMLLQTVLLIATLQAVVAVDSCQTVDGKNGDCKPINACHSLYALVQKRPISAANAYLLRKSSCGFVGAYPKVCCPVSSDVPTEKPPVVDGPRETTRTASLSSLHLPDLATCGINTQSRIYGGTVTDLDEFPWMVLLFYRTAARKMAPLCGGVLISKRYVLTAAHCAHQKSLETLQLKLLSVRLGEHNVNTNPDCLVSQYGEDCADPHVDVDVDEAILHEDYNRKNLHNDIALLRLKTDVNFTDFIKPICLPLNSEERQKTYEGQDLFVAGWGNTEDNRTTSSSEKLKVKIPVINLSECNSTYYNLAKFTLTPNQMCAGSQGKDSCKGDSGGPLMTMGRTSEGDVHWFSAGIVSYGTKKCGGNTAGVYTRVSKYVPWIVSKLKA